jgi:hypothetical protein
VGGGERVQVDERPCHGGWMSGVGIFLENGGRSYVGLGAMSGLESLDGHPWRIIIVFGSRLYTICVISELKSTY